MTTSPPPLTADAAPADQGPLAIWRDHLAAGRFMLQHCPACNRHVFYPRVLCPHCAGTALEWVECKGRATVYSTTVVSRRADQGGPYNVTLVDLDEGVRLMSRVDGMAPERVTIGLRLQHAIIEENGQPLLVFRPHG